MFNKLEPQEKAPCPWCNNQVFKVGVCLIGSEPLETCNAWRCNHCDIYLDCLGMPIGFEKVVFDLPALRHCRFNEN